MDTSKLLMHNKFVVIDSCRVINGSLNWNAGAKKGNYENFVLSCSESLAKQFTQEFDRVWKKFGGGDPNTLAETGTFVNNCAALFFPDKNDQNLKTMLEVLRSASKSVDVCVFALTLPEVVDILKKHHAAGRRVRVISDEWCS